MSRKKVIVREQILKAAYEIVIHSNFHNLTARHVADKLNCSTQPIYLEFQNMDDLKFVVYQKMKSELQRWLNHSEQFSSEPVINLCMKYIHFSMVKNDIHRTLANENFGASRDFKFFIYQLFCEKMMENNDYTALTENDKQRLVSLMWQMTIGISSTILNGLMPYDVTKVSQALDQQLHWIMQNKEYPTLI